MRQNQGMESPCRLPPPWTVHELGECFRVEDADGSSLAYFDFKGDGRRSSDFRSLSREEARRLAVNFAKLPALMGG